MTDERVRGAGSAAACLAVCLFAIQGAAQILPGERQSGFDFMGAETQAMQRDDTANPGMLWVQDGEALWNAPIGRAERSCGDCHGDASTNMRGVAARYPAYDPDQQRPINLEQRIQLCRGNRQNAPPLATESRDLLSLTAYVAHQSRGIAVTEPDDPLLETAIERGGQLFGQRQGQLGLSCSACHDANWGGRLGGSVIPQGHPTGYPLYRLEWQGLGSLQRRLRNCMIGMRAEPYSYGSPEHVDLEVYLRSRAAGLPIETPAVRP